MELEVTPESPNLDGSGAVAPEVKPEVPEVFDFEAEWEKHGGTDGDDELDEEQGDETSGQTTDDDPKNKAADGESESHASDDSGPDGQPPEAKPDELILGKFRSPDDVVKAYQDLESESGKMARKLIELERGQNNSSGTEKPPEEEKLTDEDFISLLVENPSKAKEVLRNEILQELPELGLVRQLAAEREAAAWLDETRGKYSEMPEGARFEDFEGTQLSQHINAVREAYTQGQIGEEERDYHLSQGAINQLYLEYANKALVEIAKRPKKELPTKEELENKTKLAGSSSTKGKGGSTAKISFTDPRDAFDQEWRNQKKASKTL